MSPKTLCIMRHAKAKRDESKWQDFDRPLSRRGELDCKSIAEIVVQKQWIPDLICASSAARTEQTAKLMAEEVGFDQSVLLRRELYMGTPSKYLAEIKRFPVSINRALVIGHNPGLEELIGQMTREWIALPTSGLVAMTMSEQDWSLADRTPWKVVATHFPVHD